MDQLRRPITNAENRVAHSEVATVPSNLGNVVQLNKPNPTLENLHPHPHNINACNGLLSATGTSTITTPGISTFLNLYSSPHFKLHFVCC